MEIFVRFQVLVKKFLFSVDYYGHKNISLLVDILSDSSDLIGTMGLIQNNAEDVQKLREMERSGEMMACTNKISVVMAKPTEIQGLMEAFDGCRGVFHTSAFADPGGISGYSVSSVMFLPFLDFFFFLSNHIKLVPRRYCM